MKNKFFVFLKIAFLICGAFITVNAQKSKEGQVSVRIKNGISVVFTSTTEPPVSGRQITGGIQFDGKDNTMRRIFVDSERGVYFGYDLTVEPLADKAGRFKLTFKPLSLPKLELPFFPPEPLTSRSAGAGGNAQPLSDDNRRTAPFTELALPKLPKPQVLTAGDTLALDVLINPQSGIKIVDLIKVSTSNERFSESFPTAYGGQQSASVKNPQTKATNKPTAAGGKVSPSNPKADTQELKVNFFNLVINGRTIIGNENEISRAAVMGTLIWFYLPERGRFIISLVPHNGYNFQKAGTIQGNKISFSIDGERYEWISGFPVVAPDNRVRDLWVLHDLNFKPHSSLVDLNEPWVIGASDRIEDLIKKK